MIAISFQSFISTHRFGTELSDVESLKDGQWSIEGSMEMPKPREKHCAVVMEQKTIVVLGGVGIDSVIAYDLDDVSHETFG